MKPLDESVFVEMKMPFDETTITLQNTWYKIGTLDEET